MRKRFFLLIIFPISSFIFGASPETQEIEQRIESVFGVVERNQEGAIIGVDLARDRASASDDVLRSALSIPNLKRFRFAGGSIAAESLEGIMQQRDLEELYLQDVPIGDDDWRPLIEGHPKLSRLTLRRMPNLSSKELAALPRRIPKLRNLSLINMELSGESLAEIALSEILAALDLRNCSRLRAEDYACLTSMPKLIDLKIGGFGVTDDVLAKIAPLPLLRGLTIDDAIITPEGFATWTSNFASADKLETLVLSRNSALFDPALLPIKNFPKLKRLTVNGMMVTGSFLEQLAEDETTRPKLQRLSLRKAFLSEEGLTALKKYPELRILDLSGVAITAELVEIILSLDRLEELDVTGCGLDKDTLLRLESMPSLKRVVR
ncbi:MAG: hypothetical protein LBI05_12260 [Planctomycetaceae bacterium]|nr:hypothetical protein [Planctomycetaceae bacterium]